MMSDPAAKVVGGNAELVSVCPPRATMTNPTTDAQLIRSRRRRLVRGYGGRFLLMSRIPSLESGTISAAIGTPTTRLE